MARTFHHHRLRSLYPLGFAACHRRDARTGRKNHGLKAKGGMGKSQAEEKGGATRLSSVSWRVLGC